MKTAKEKAIELVDRFEHETYSLVKDDLAKQCALIAVDEIIELLDFDLGHDVTARTLSDEYKQIKSEIDKL